MRYRDGTDPEEVRAQLHRLTEDVEPAPDALPRLLAANRRRSGSRRPALVTAAAGLAVTGLFLSIVLIPSQLPPDTEQASVGPNSYVAEPEPGLLAEFDVLTGRQLHPIGRVEGASSATLAVDGERVYRASTEGTATEIVEVDHNGPQRVVAEIPGAQSDAKLAAGGGRVAYGGQDEVLLWHAGEQRRLPVPEGRRTADLTQDGDGRLAVLTVAEHTGSADTGPAEIHVVDPADHSMLERQPIGPTGGCGPLALAWSGQDIAVLQRVSCESPRMRVSLLDAEDGNQVGASAPFSVGPAALDSDVSLSSDPLGRFLVSAPETGQWLVDGAEVRPVRPACSPEGACAETPGVFWN